MFKDIICLGRRYFGQFTNDKNLSVFNNVHLFFQKPPKMSEPSANPTENQSKKGKIRHTKEERKQMLKQRRQEKKADKNVGFSESMLNQTQYYFENGFRKVYPYFFGWNTTAKERWFGMTLLDLYKKEFQRAIINQSVENLIESGKIRVNGHIKQNDYVIKNGDKISHFKHRHEIPVLADPIKVIYEDDNYVVVDKPCSIPIHPCGKFRYNSLLIILIKEMGYSNLRTMYRLDRLTSGLVIMGKNFKASLLIDKHIKERTASKTYLARVVGDFPSGKISVDKPIGCASPKLGLHWINEQTGKSARTVFEKISFNGTTSLVRCNMETGRTHQIRIHLQYLGFPIANDPLYNQPIIWGENNGKDAVYPLTREQMEQNFLKIHSYEAWIINQEQSDADNVENKGDEASGQDTTSSEKRKPDELEEIGQTKRAKTEARTDTSDDTSSAETSLKKDIESGDRAQFDKSLLEIDPDCFECKNTYRDPERNEIIMYLHAYSYKFDELFFQTELPRWAYEDFKD